MTLGREERGGGWQLNGDREVLLDGGGAAGQ